MGITFGSRYYLFILAMSIAYTVVLPRSGLGARGRRSLGTSAPQSLSDFGETGAGSCEHRGQKIIHRPSDRQKLTFPDDKILPWDFRGRNRDAALVGRHGAARKNLAGSAIGRGRRPKTTGPNSRRCCATSDEKVLPWDFRGRT